MLMFKAGDHIIVGSNVYGGTYRHCSTRSSRTSASQFSWIDMRDVQRVEGRDEAEHASPCCIETPTNPLMQLADIKAASRRLPRSARCALSDRGQHIRLAHTCRPRSQLGADIVWHSSTKYLNGHSDIIGGVAVHQLGCD